jgi:WhiB family transcriptional regulator, redox-sensing transcriptional regulator
MTEVSSLRRPPNSPQDWRVRGACRGRDLTQFYPGENEPRSRVRLKEAQAKAMCRRCPVRPECAALALATHERHGIWGGFTTQERMRLLVLGWEDLASTARTSVDAQGLERRLQTQSGQRRSGARRTAG